MLIITGIIVIVAVAVALLLFPVTINAKSNKDGAIIKGDFSISWLVFHIRYLLQDSQTEIFLFNRRIITLQNKEEPDKKEPAKPEEIKKPKKLKKSRKSPPVRQIAHLVGPILRLFGDLVNTIKFKSLDVDITYGFEDPACSGILTGFLHAVHGAFRLGKNIRFTPDFTEPVLDWYLSASAAITPIKLFPPIVKFAANRQVLRSGWAIIRI
jgi:hypothetical protein